MGQWRYSAGQKGVNRVTVFERTDAPSIYVEWFDDFGRHRRSLKTATGHPVTDRSLARRIADKMAGAQQQKRNQQAAEMLGLGTGKRLPDLLHRLHEDRAARWSETYTRDQARYRDFWLDALGKIELVKVTAGTVERVAREAGQEKGWSPRTEGAVLRYLVDAFYFAERKLKWITPSSNLSAVTIPDRKSRGVAYTVAEAKALLPALEATNVRAGWIGWVCATTGRRLTAVRTLEKAHVVDNGDHAVIDFPAETDKAGRFGQAVISGPALRLFRELKDQPGRYVCGAEPPTLEDCRDWMLAAEEQAGVPHVKGRSWHGLKRLFATRAKGHAGRSRQSGTTEATLERVYLQDEVAPKVELAQRLTEELGG